MDSKGWMIVALVFAVIALILNLTSLSIGILKNTEAIEKQQVSPVVPYGVQVSHGVLDETFVPIITGECDHTNHYILQEDGEYCKRNYRLTARNNWDGTRTETKTYTGQFCISEEIYFRNSLNNKQYQEQLDTYIEEGGLRDHFKFKYEVTHE